MNDQFKTEVPNPDCKICPCFNNAALSPNKIFYIKYGDFGHKL